MAKVRWSFLTAALLLAAVNVGCGQEGTGSASGTGGDTGKDSSRSSSAGGAAASVGSGGASGPLSRSSEAGGQLSDTGGSSTSSSSGGGGASASSLRGGTSGGGSSQAGGAGSQSTRADAGLAGGSSLAPDAGRSQPQDIAVPTGDAAVIPPLPVRQDAGVSFWATVFAGNCKPPAIGGRAQDDGHHKPGANCMTSGCHLNPKAAKHHAGTDCRGSGCHSNGSPDGSGAPAFLFGGTAYRAATLVAEVAAEIGVKTSSASYTACSASNGNFWVMPPGGTTSLNWTGASARLRNANGEAPMMTAPGAGCNASACHTGTLKITAP